MMSQFCGNREAVENMADIQSLLATCKAHDVTPRLYIKGVPYKEKVSQSKEVLLEMLPHKWKLTHPEAVITK